MSRQHRETCIGAALDRLILAGADCLPWPYMPPEASLESGEGRRILVIVLSL
jgi:hypothetical protein